MIDDDNQEKVDNGEPGYLHDRFVRQQTLLYDVKPILPNDLLIAKPQLLKAVQCEWLQNYAAFWLFSENRHNPIRLRYSQQSALLQPEALGLSIFTKEVKAHIPNPPIVAIGSFSHQEHYVRIALPRMSRRRLRINVPYSCQFPPSASSSSRGLLSAVMQALAKRKVNIDYVLNSTSELTPDSEDGSISFICSVPSNSNVLEADVNTALQSIDGCTAKIDTAHVRVGRLGAKIVFISTRLMWATVTREGFLDRVKELVKDYGFVPSTGETTNNAANLEEEIANRIRMADAFLQIIPSSRATGEDEDPLYWVTYELGIARGASLPISLCVDEEFEIAKIRPLEGWFIRKFSSRGNTEPILTRVIQALKHLQNEIYEPNEAN